MKNTPNAVKSGVVPNRELIQPLCGQGGGRQREDVLRYPRSPLVQPRGASGPVAIPRLSGSRQGPGAGQRDGWALRFALLEQPWGGGGRRLRVQRGWEGRRSPACSFDPSRLTWGSVSQSGHRALFSAREEGLWEPVFAFAVGRMGLFLDHTSKYGRLLVFNSLTH